MEKSIVKTSVRKRKITSGTREWADYNVNCVAGCFNNCRCCYAKIMAKRFGRATEETWKLMKVRHEAVSKNYRKKPGRVMFPSSHDIIDEPEVREACFTVLSNLLKNGNDVLITTKPKLRVIQEIDEKFSKYDDRIQFRFTITSIEDDLLRFWEPNAPSFAERISSLKYAFSKDYKTSVSIEPFLDYDPEALVRYVEPYCTESIWIGKMNYIQKNNLSSFEQQYYEKVRKNYSHAHLKEIYWKLKENPKIRFKDSFGVILDQNIGNSCEI
ncbi:MAG: radical SAM protein [Promethearchaeota archaeon]